MPDRSRLSDRDTPEAAGEGFSMDAWFIGLTIILALSTWGTIVLFARVLKQP